MTGADGHRDGHEPPHRFETEDGVEVLVQGPSRMALTRTILADRAAICAKALRLMADFLHPAFQENCDAFDLVTVDVFAEPTIEGGDFSLRFFFGADPQEYGSTYFDVFFRCHAPPAEPIWPFRFTVGFH